MREGGEGVRVYVRGDGEDVRGGGEDVRLVGV